MNVLINRCYARFKLSIIFSVLAWVGSIPIGLATSASLVVTPLIHRFGNRVVAFIGVILCFASCILTSVITTFPPIYVTYSLLFGGGIGCMSLSSMNLLLQYFPNKNCSRATLLSLVGSSSGTYFKMRIKRFTRSVFSERNKYVRCVKDRWGFISCTTFSI